MSPSLKLGLAQMPTAAIHALWNNLIEPLQNGVAIAELQGKYKPSWIAPPGIRTPIADAMIAFSRKQSLYHYHVGYPYYKTGRDPDYPGDESNAIVHVRDSETALHLLRMDLEHPSPFIVPTDLTTEQFP